MKIYIASRPHHAPKWRALRDSGVPIKSSWIDYGEDFDPVELSDKCVWEAAAADILILYAEPGETLAGALIEVGAALAFGAVVISVGEWENIPDIFIKHPSWKTAKTIEEAINP